MCLVSDERSKKTKNFTIYKFIKLSGALILTAIYAIGGYMISDSFSYGVIMGAVILIPFYLYFSRLVNNIYSRKSDDIVVPMMNYRDHVPDTAKTLVNVPVLGISGEHLIKVLNHLHLIAVNNGTQNIAYTLLVDFPSSLDNAEEKEIASSLADEVEKLNKKAEDEYIYAFFRKKSYNPITKEYMGYEGSEGLY